MDDEPEAWLDLLEPDLLVAVEMVGEGEALPCVVGSRILLFESTAILKLILTSLLDREVCALV